MNEGIAVSIITVKTTIRAYPQASLAITKQTGDHIDTDTGAICIVMQESGYLIAVETIQAIVSWDPDRAILILTDIGNKTTGEALGREEMTCLRTKRAAYNDTNE